MTTERTKLSPEECDRIGADITQLEESETQTPRDFERVLGEILRPLLRSEGFELDAPEQPGVGDNGLDFRGRRGDAEAGTLEQIGVEAKFFRRDRPVNADQVRALIGAALTQDVSRAILVTNSSFNRRAQEVAEHNLPVSIELKTLRDLRNWVELVREDAPDEGSEAEVRIILQAVSERFARLIARDPGALAHLEWRDVERTIAEVFDGLGFKVTLTPGSKDGGKDVVLECEVAGKLATYYVEIKHWRSATRVGAGAVEKLLKVIVSEKKAGGLFLSTFGFTENAFEQLTTIDKQRLKFGDQEKVVTLCRTYVKAKAGIWSPPRNLTEVLFDE